MSNVYQEKPNIVTVQISDANGTAERFIVGRSLDEVIASVDPASQNAAPKKKERKPRSPNKPKPAAAEAEKKPEPAADEKKETAWP